MRQHSRYVGMYVYECRARERKEKRRNGKGGLGAGVWSLLHTLTFTHIHTHTHTHTQGNPLLAGGSGSAQIKRKWNDDVVFKNQSRGETEKKKRFINDTIRNDFHKAFLSRYMK